ncbi:MAG: response regulator [Alphaproteobacteria bacterium]|nr:MAG: response regulator [Alphaproteobacteria bacterium]
MCHVLVIEDDWLIGEDIECVARDNGATSVDRAETEADAVALALARPPAVILSDVQLLEGTGPLAVLAIREHLGPLPVIFITATPDACQPCDYAATILRKPIMLAEVSQAFLAILPR